MLKRILMSSLIVVPLAYLPVAGALAQSTEGTSGTTTVITNTSVDENTAALVTRQQERMGMLESGLKDLRGIVEQDLRQLKMQIAQLSSSASNEETDVSADIRAITSQLERLTDNLAMTNRRMERTLEITSDVEFRLLRMEKRLQTLMSLGGDELANAAVQQDMIAGGAAKDVQMTRNASTGAVDWSVDEQALNAQLAADGANASDNLSGGAEAGAEAGSVAGSVAGSEAGSQTGGDVSTNGNTQLAAVDTKDDQAGTDQAANAESTAALEAPATPQVLPDVSPEEQYRFALSRALQNDLETAELAFAEFRVFNAGHSREPDAAFWLGRVQFMRGQYEKAAMTFSQFNSSYPNDARLVDTTMWIAESVSHFAPKEQACAIYASLPQLLDTPPESFYTRLEALSKAANCDG